MVQSRRLRMDDETGMDVESIAALLSAQQYGPQAMQKIMALLGSDSITSRTWPPGKKVKVFIQEMDAEKEPKEKPKVFVWKPESEYFHEVILKQAGIGDFEVFYQDEDGDKVQVEATKPSIEAFLADQAKEQKPKLQVEWRPATTALEKFKSTVSSTCTRAKNWLTGGGGATDQTVKAAQEQVEKKGGKIIVCSGSGRSLVDHKGYMKEAWPEAVEGLSIELGLSKDERAALLNARLREEGKAQHFRQKIIGNTIVTEFIAYHTVCHGDKIDVVYGKHEESMEVTGGATSLPSANCIQYNDTLFAVWPPGSPHGQTATTEMCNSTAELPSGWKLVDSSQEGFDSIRARVIVPYGWQTNCLVTSGPNGKLEGWKTLCWSNAGERWTSEQMENRIQKKDEARFHIKGGWQRSSRLLIQASPSTSHELVSNWQRYVQLSAEREWSQRLGMRHGGSIEE